MRNAGQYADGLTTKRMMDVRTVFQVSRVLALTATMVAAAIGAHAAEDGWFPTGDPFDALVADPHQPRFAAAYSLQRTRNDTYNFFRSRGLVPAMTGTLGGTVGIWGFADSSQALRIQVDVALCAFALFRASPPMVTLISGDFTAGLPITARWGMFSARLQFFHQSSHLGDEFVLDQNAPNHSVVSYEAIELVVAAQEPWWRIYLAAAAALHQPQPAPGTKLQAGFELRAPPDSGPGAVRLQIRPVIGADLAAYQNNRWGLTYAIKAGVESAIYDGRTPVRALLTYMGGYSSLGQFFDRTRADSFGVELQWDV